MKTMKKLMSMLMLVCILASILSVSAFATGNPYDLVKPTVNATTYWSSDTVTITGNITAVDSSEIKSGTVYLQTLGGRTNIASASVSSSSYTLTVSADTLVASSYSNGIASISDAYIYYDDGNGKAGASPVTDAITVQKLFDSLTITSNVTSPITINGTTNCVLTAATIPAGGPSLVNWSVDYSASKGDVSFGSSNSSSSTTVSPVKAGKVRIVATSTYDTSKSATIDVNVDIPVSQINIIPESIQLDLSSKTTETLAYTLNPSGAVANISWNSSNPAVATVDANGKVTAVAGGNTTITASIPGTSATDSVIVYVNDANRASVSFNTSAYTIAEGEEIVVTASLNKVTSVTEWRLANSALSSYLRLEPQNDGVSVRVIGLADYAYPIEVEAIARVNSTDSTSGRFTVKVDDSLPLYLEASAERVTSGNNTVVTVRNWQSGESFNWTYNDYGRQNVVASISNSGLSTTMLAGKADGVVTITATSTRNANRTASIDIYVNAAAPYGTASITPSYVNWARGNTSLNFRVTPTVHSAYLDSTLLNNYNLNYAYYTNGYITLTPAYLNTLSSGSHTLTVYTRSDGDTTKQPDGLVYATIYVNGTASNYGDSVHVKGSAYNLYFTSTSPINRVYISNTYIDPSNYTLDATRKQLTLKSSFLNQLAYGNYTMALETDSGATETATFRIVAANYAPATGDDNNILAWMAALAISGAGVIALIPRKKKQM